MLAASEGRSVGRTTASRFDPSIAHSELFVLARNVRLDKGNSK
jgi:hypothetical protein